MSRLTLSIAAVAASATLIATPALAATIDQVVAGTMCQGSAATVVGDPAHDVVRGTPGDDVIVTRGVFEVRAGAGDDLICVTGSPDDETGNVHAGAGTDSVEVEPGSSDFVWAELGPGADSFLGGDEWDRVWAGVYLPRDDQGPEDARDDDADVISTGAGMDLVIVGEPGTPLEDAVDTGHGEDEIYVNATGMTGPGALQMGAGYDTLIFEWPDQVGGTWLFDAATGTASENEVQRFAWAGVEEYELPEPGPNAVSFHGSDRNETVWAATFHAIDLGGGGDLFRNASYSQFPGTTPGSLDGGPGDDGILAQDYLQYRIDLAQGRANFDNENMFDFVIEDVEDVEAYGGRGEVEVTGDALDNDLVVYACSFAVSGRGGDDHISGDAFGCPTSSTPELRGGPGNDVILGTDSGDRLAGGSGDDRLLGRGGHDRANGGPGVDVCKAEVRRSCRQP